jgi:hypothetical protein
MIALNVPSMPTVCSHVCVHAGTAVGVRALHGAGRRAAAAVGAAGSASGRLTNGGGHLIGTRTGWWLELWQVEGRRGPADQDRGVQPTMTVREAQFRICARRIAPIFAPNCASDPNCAQGAQFLTSGLTAQQTLTQR